MSAHGFVLAVAAVQGLLAGSFLNVCIQRLPRGGSVVRPRSQCMACGHPVRWFDNVPVLSYLVLRGRCCDCSTRISPLYPAVEVATGAWFIFSALPLAHAYLAGDVAENLMLALLRAVATAVFGFLLLGLLCMDWKNWTLPDEFTLGGLFLGLFFAAAESFWVPSVPYKTFFTPEEVFFGRRLAAAVLGYIVLKAIAFLYRAWRGRTGIGSGDAKMLAFIGAFLGLQGMALAFFVALLTCTCFALWLVLARRAHGKTAVPFGSFLSIGGLVAAAAGDRILNWYAALFH